MAKKEKKQKDSKSGLKVLDAQRGTPIWGFKLFKEDGLVQLMLDILDKEAVGLEDAHCEIVRNSLEKISIHLSAIPDKFWIRASIMESFDKFKNSYSEWNNIKGGDENAIMLRRITLGKMKKHRQKLATAVRKNGHILSQALDLKLIEDIYETLGSISKALPGLFVNLARAVKRFKKKK